MFRTNAPKRRLYSSPPPQSTQDDPESEEESVGDSNEPNVLFPRRRNLPDFIVRRVSREEALTGSGNSQSSSSSSSSSLLIDGAPGYHRITKSVLEMCREKLLAYVDPEYKKGSAAYEAYSQTPPSSQMSEIRLSQTSLLEESVCINLLIRYFLNHLTLSQIEACVRKEFRFNWRDVEPSDLFDNLVHELNTSPHGMLKLVETCVDRLVDADDSDSDVPSAGQRSEPTASTAVARSGTEPGPLSPPAKRVRFAGIARARLPTP